MQFPLISEYKEAILNAEDNFDKLSNLRPVLDAYGAPIMSSGNFAVVFKMTDGKKDYAIKCFLREQEERAEAYKQICEYLSGVESEYIVHTEYLENELFVDTSQSDDEEFPVLKMDWVNGVTLERYMDDIRNNQDRRVSLFKEFQKLSVWLLAQDFAHTDVKPDNILVARSNEYGRERLHLVLVDYDGMFVPSMEGQRARELGTPLYRFRGRTLDDFNERCDDYACVFIMLVLKINSLKPASFDQFTRLSAATIIGEIQDFVERRDVSPLVSAFLMVSSEGVLNRQLLHKLLGNNAKSVNAITGTQSAGASSGTGNPWDDKMETVLIKAGTFMMGTSPTEACHNSDETWHQVTLTNDFYMGKYEVTNAQFCEFLNDKGIGSDGTYTTSDYGNVTLIYTYYFGVKYSDDKWKPQSGYENYPVTCVTWYGANEYAKWIGGSLPTEAQWEYACRAGSTTAYCFDDNGDNLGNYAWYLDNSEDHTHPVDLKRPNAWGLYDMLGNVLEWCADWYGTLSSSTVMNPNGASSGRYRILRGGGCDYPAGDCRSASRYSSFPNNCDYNIGFRVCFPVNDGICYHSVCDVCQDSSMAAEHGNTKAQYNLGLHYANGRGVKQDYAIAVKWYTKAAEQGDVKAQCNLGWCYENGRGVKQDYATAVKWYTKAAEQGNARAQCNLGCCYENGRGVEQNYATAVKWYNKATKQEHARAQCNLGWCYENGKGIKQDYTTAVKWYTKAAEQGNAQAQCNLGCCYENGRGVKQDYATSAKWYSKAAEQENAFAQYYLARCYEKGRGVNPSYAIAVELFTEAAEHGNTKAQYNLGCCYENGSIVKQNYATAVKWYTKAAEQGDADAQVHLGRCYERGRGVKQDYAIAVKWYKKAAEQGMEIAAKRIKEIEWRL